MNNLPFRLKVHKFKCGSCDLIYLIEQHREYHPSWYTCPQCNCSPVIKTKHMGDITIVEKTKRDIRNGEEMKKRIKKKLAKRNKFKCKECRGVIDLKGYYGSINDVPCVCGNCINTDY